MQVDWGDFPTWVEALATIGAFVAAGLAARWAAGALTEAKKQASAAQDQVTAAQGQVAAARDQLELAREQAERERATAKAAEERFIRAQLDARAPIVYARARPGSDNPSYMFWGSNGSWPRPPLAAITEPQWRADQTLMNRRDSAVTAQLTIGPGDEPMMFELAVTIEFVNCSNIPARIDVTSHPNSEISLRSGQELVVPPSTSRFVLWTRRFGSQLLSTEELINDPNLSLFQFEYWVRDLTHNVRDTYCFNSSVQHFKRDGSRLIVEPRPPYPWTEDIASMSKPRIYERFDLPTGYTLQEQAPTGIT